MAESSFDDLTAVLEGEAPLVSDFVTGLVPPSTFTLFPATPVG